jgi:hypothetical protein
VAALVDTSILEDSWRVPHQAIVEFVAAATRPVRGHIILKQADALPASSIGSMRTSGRMPSI